MDLNGSLNKHFRCIYFVIYVGVRNSFSQQWLSQLAAQRSNGGNAHNSKSIEMKNRDHFVALDEAEAALGTALEATLEVAGLERKRGMILPFQPLSISFDDLKYYVDMPSVRFSSTPAFQTILHNIFI